MCDWEDALPATLADSLHCRDSQTRYILLSHWFKWLITLPVSLFCTDQQLSLSSAISFSTWPTPLLFQSPFIYLPFFLQLVPFWFYFPLASFFLNPSKSNMKNLDRNTDCQHAIPSIYLFPLFPACFPFHHKDHRDCKAEITSWRRFFQHPGRWDPILLHTMLISRSMKLFKEQRTIRNVRKNKYPEAQPSLISIICQGVCFYLCSTTLDFFRTVSY